MLNLSVEKVTHSFTNPDLVFLERNSNLKAIWASRPEDHLQIIMSPGGNNVECLWSWLRIEAELTRVMGFCGALGFAID